MEAINSRPYFLWDYDLNEADVHRILKSTNETDRIWMASRILESARYEDVWRYLTLDEVYKLFPILKLKPAVRQVWAFALRVWQENEANR